MLLMYLLILKLIPKVYDLEIIEVDSYYKVIISLNKTVDKKDFT
jgi:hypothetical protein